MIVRLALKNVYADKLHLTCRLLRICASNIVLSKYLSERAILCWWSGQLYGMCGGTIHAGIWCYRLHSQSY